MKTFCVAAMLLLSGMGASAAEPAPTAPAADARLADGPYVTRENDGTWLSRRVEGTFAAPQVIMERSATPSVIVPAVADLPAFTVPLRPPAVPTPDDSSFPASTPLFVMADTHGEYEIVTTFLKAQKVIGPDLKWSFGKGHLAILGDVFDRGAHHTELLWLYYKLEGEAVAAGGGFHMTLGNHETMNLRGDLRYLNPKYPAAAKALGAATYAELFEGQSVLGQWLRTKPAVMRINDGLFMHGGISPALIERGLSLAQINTTSRAVLNGTDVDADLGKFVMGNSGPFWYRGYFVDEKGVQASTPADIAAIKKHFNVNRVFVGHTIVETVTPLYDGAVIAVQVYPHLDKDTGKPVLEGVLVKDRKVFRATITGALEPLK